MDTTKDVLKIHKENLMNKWDNHRQLASIHEEIMLLNLQKAEEIYDEIEKCEDALNALE